MYTQDAMRRRSIDASEGNPNICIRLSSEEHERWVEVFKRAKRRNHLANKTDVARELLGLVDNVLLTERDIGYFRGGKPKLKIVGE